MSDVIKPPRLRSGDRVALIAPASPFPREELDRGVAELRALGFEPVFDDSVFAQDRGYLSGTSEIRTAAFLRYWHDPTVRALIGVRGGFGSVHLLPGLAPAELRRAPKIFVGYSDLTSLLSHLTIGCGITSFHGPMVDRRLSRGAEGYDRDTFLRVLTRAEPLGELAGDGLEVLRPGEGSGLLAGGTLSQLVASLGTPFAFAPPAGHVLFLEEVGERPYRLDRMLTQLRLSGILDRASGVLLGDFVECDEPKGRPAARDVLAALLADFPGPVLYGMPSGHTTKPFVTLPFGVRTRIAGGPDPRVIVEEAAVA